MKAILASIDGFWLDKIILLHKSIEVCKTAPKIPPPFKVYAYCSKGGYYGKSTDYKRAWFFNKLDREPTNGKVAAEFVCDRLFHWSSYKLLDGIDISDEDMEKGSLLTAEQMRKYEESDFTDDFGSNLIGLYGWNISNLKVYDHAKPLSDFVRPLCERVSDCGSCRHWDNETFDCGRGNIITRPPQSWMYVEELP